MKTMPCLLTIGTSLLFAAATGFSGGAHPSHTIINPQDIVWSAAPAKILPAGAQIAILQGSIETEGPLTLRLKLPANYIIPPHTHNQDEGITILSGSLQMGFGESFQIAALRPFDTGGFNFLPANEPHYVKTNAEETIVQINSRGPWTITYINAGDDPNQSER